MTLEFQDKIEIVGDVIRFDGDAVARIIPAEKLFGVGYKFREYVAFLLSDDSDADPADYVIAKDIDQVDFEMLQSNILGEIKARLKNETGLYSIQEIVAVISALDLEDFATDTTAEPASAASRSAEPSRETQPPTTPEAPQPSPAQRPQPVLVRSDSDRPPPEEEAHLGWMP